MKKLIVAAIMAGVLATGASAKGHDRHERHDRSDGDTRIWLPIGLSILTPPVQLPNPTHTVFGGMLNLGF